MKDEKANATIEVKGLDTFRRVVTLTTLIFSCVSVLIILINPRECETNDQMRNGVIVTLSVQLSIFTLLLLHYIHCGCLLRKIGAWLGIFYFVLTGLMTWV